MSGITKHKTVKRSTHFSEELFQTRLNLTKASAYFNLSKKQREYIDSYADEFCKTVRLKDGRIMSAEEFKQWWHETFVLPKRKKNLEAVLEARGVCHSATISGLANVNTRRDYNGYNFNQFKLTWYEKETTASIRLSGRAQNSKTPVVLVDSTFPCKSLKRFEDLRDMLKRVTTWMAAQAIDFVNGTYTGDFQTELRDVLRKPRVPKVVITPPAEPETHRFSDPRLTLQAMIEKAETQLTLSWNMRTLIKEMKRQGEWVLLEMEYLNRVMSREDHPLDISGSLPLDLNCLGVITFIAQEIMSGDPANKDGYVRLVTEELIEMAGGLYATNLINQFFLSLVNEGLPEFMGGSLVDTIHYSLTLPIQKFGRFDPMFKPHDIVKCYREFARIALALRAAREGQLAFVIGGDLETEIRKLDASISDDFIKEQYQKSEDGWNHTFNHARIKELLAVILRVDVKPN